MQKEIGGCQRKTALFFWGLFTLSFSLFIFSHALSDSNNETKGELRVKHKGVRCTDYAVTKWDLEIKKKGLGISRKHYSIAVPVTADCYHVLKTKNESRQERNETRKIRIKPLLTFLRCAALVQRQKLQQRRSEVDEQRVVVKWDEVEAWRRCMKILQSSLILRQCG
jgi:hypothetical protein